MSKLVTDQAILGQLESESPTSTQPVTDPATIKALEAAPVDNMGEIIARQAGNLGRKAKAVAADTIRQMDTSVDYSGVESPTLRAEYGFMDTPEERQQFLEKHFGKGNVSQDSFGRDVVSINGQKVAFLPRGGKDTGKPGAAGSSWADVASDVLPVAGMTAGGVIGAPLTIGPVPVGSIAGAGLGGAAGKAGNKLIKQALGGNLQSAGETAKDIALEAPKGAVAQATGEVLGLAGRSIARGPFRERSIFGPWTAKGKEAFRKAQAEVSDARALGLKPKVGTYSPNASFTQRVQNAGFRLFGDDLTLKNRPIIERESGKLTGGAIANTPEATEAINRGISVKAGELIKTAQTVADAAKAQADAALKQAEEAITTKVGTPSGNLGASVAKDVFESKQAFSMKAAELYAPIDAMAGKPVVPTAGLKATMRRILSEGPQTTGGQPVFASDTIKKFAGDIQAMPDHISFQQMQVARSTLRDRASVEALNAGLSERQAARLAKAADTAFDEAAAGPFAGSAQATAALRRADRFYAAGMQRFNDLTVEALVKDATRSGFVEPEKVASRIAMPGMNDKLQRIQKLVTPETFGQVGAAKWQQMLTESRDPLTGNVSGKQLSAALKKMGPVLETLYGKQEATNMVSYAEHLAALNGQIGADALKAGKLSQVVKDAVLKKEASDEIMKRGFVRALQTDGPESLTAAQWLTEPEHRLALRQAIGAFGPQSQEVRELKEYLARRIFSSMEVPATRGAEKYGTTELMGEPLQKELTRYGRPYLEEVFGKPWTDAAYTFAKQAETATRKNPVDSGGLLAATLGLHWLRHLGEIARYFTAGELLSTDPVITYLSKGIEGGGVDFLQKLVGGGMQISLNYGAEEIPKRTESNVRGLATHAKRALDSYTVPGRQFGGPVAAGQPYVVGEKRPEIFVPRVPGYIVAQADAMNPQAQKAYKDALGATIDAREKAATPPVRTSQGVVAVPPNLRGLVDLVIKTGRARNEQEALKYIQEHGMAPRQ